MAEKPKIHCVDCSQMVGGSDTDMKAGKMETHGREGKEFGKSVAGDNL